MVFRHEAAVDNLIEVAVVDFRRHEASSAGALRGVGKSEVYDHGMGLFRRRARKNREKAAAEVPKEHTGTAEAQAVVVRRKVTAEARPNPDQPGWGRTIGQQIGKAREDRACQE